MNHLQLIGYSAASIGVLCVASALLAPVVAAPVGPKTEHVIVTGTAASSHARPLHIDYGPLGPLVREDYDFDFDQGIQRRSPAADIALFRRRERHPLQGLNWQGVLEQAQYERALFYSAAERAPRLVTAQDWKWVREDEIYILQTECEDEPDSDIDPKVCAKVAKLR